MRGCGGSHGHTTHIVLSSLASLSFCFESRNTAGSVCVSQDSQNCRKWVGVIEVSEKETFARSSAFLWHLRFKHNFFKVSGVDIALQVLIMVKRNVITMGNSKNHRWIKTKTKSFVQRPSITSSTLIGSFLCILS